MPSKSRTMKILYFHYVHFNPHNILWILLLLLGKCVLLISAGNLNEIPQWTVTIPDRNDIEFGFSLAHLFNQSQHRLLVGAPRDNTSQVDVVSPGALYSCTFTTGTSNADCDQLQVDWRNKDDKYKGFGWIDDDFKDYQRLGASLATSDKGVVVCAPGWHIFVNYKTGKEDLPFGLCFEAREETNFVFEKKKEFSMAYNSTGKQSYEKGGACQAGFSVAYSQSSKQDSIAIGSPGCLLWQGDTWQKDGGVLNTVNEDLPHRRIEKMPLEDLDLTEDTERFNKFDMVSETYLGYSVAVGEFAGAFGIVTSMPRTASTYELSIDTELSPKVVGPIVHIYHYDNNHGTKLKHWFRLIPPVNKTDGREPEPNALFSYFGYALAVADLNNDGLDDVVVGAPFYRNGTDDRTGHDGGAIFVYMQKMFSQDNAETPNIYKMERDDSAEWLPGRLKLGENSQFGAAVAAIGDINRDGYQDIAVGAPYFKDEDGNKGAVFIFIGGSDGLSREPLQVLYATSSLTDHAGPIIGFGHAIAPKFSATDQKITDLAVGAFQNDTVFIYRSKELIRINVKKFEFSSNMDLTNKNCSYNSEMYACVTLKVCLHYEVELDMGWHNKIREFQIQIEADSRKQRLMFDSGEKTDTIKMSLDDNEKNCEKLTILAKNDIRDSISSFPITYSVSFMGVDGDQATWTHDVVLEATEDLNILVDCKDPIPENCEADINLVANTKSNFSLSSSTNLKVEFMIHNKGEQAFDTKLYIDSNGDLVSSGQANATWKNNEWDDSIVTCEERRERKSKIVCKLAAIFPTYETLRVILSMSPSERFGKSYGKHPDYFNIKANVISTSKFTHPEQAETSFQIPIIVLDQLDLTSKTIPQRVEYNSSYNKFPVDAQSFNVLGPQIKHEYTLYNPERYEIYMTQCTFRWPLKLKGMYWNYLTKAPSFTGVQTSECVIQGGDIDEYNIAEKLQETKSHKNDIYPKITSKAGPSSLIHSKRGETRSSSAWNEDISWMTLTCDIGPISKRGTAKITLRSRLVQATLTSLKLGIDIQEMWSNADCQATKLPLDAPPSGKQSIKKTVTTIAYNYETPESEFPIWIIVVSVIGGLLLLALIGLICWKCGFFERKRPDQTDGMETDKDGYEEVPEDDVEATGDIEKTEYGEGEEEEEELDKKSVPTTSA